MGGSQGGFGKSASSTLARESATGSGFGSDISTIVSPFATHEARSEQAELLLGQQRRSLAAL